MKHRLSALLCAISLALSLVPSAAALEGESLRAADTLSTLQIVHGTPEGRYQLTSPATRSHAAVLLVRLAGREAAAKTDPWFAGHRDVTGWSAYAINYAIHQGWIDNEPFQLDFHPEATVTANEWCGALLRLSGFTGEDFTAEDAAAFALRIGLISQPCADPMTRGELFASALDALLYQPGEGNSLLTSLVETRQVPRSAANALGLLSPALSARQIADRHLSAVFRLDCFGDSVQMEADIPASNASGFFITPEGLAVTNYHSIEGANAARATLSTGESYPVESVIWYDKGMDLAVIQVSRTSRQDKTTSAFATLELIGSQDLRVGDTVYAIGNPLGLGLAVNEGKITALGHQVPRYSQPCIVSNADISHGSSGGALLNVYGHVISVTSGAYVHGNSMYLSVPVDPLFSVDLTVPGKTLEQITALEADN